MTDVVSIYGGPTGERQPSLVLIEALEDILERARSGEIIGGVFCGLYHDGLSDFSLAGKVGGYGLIGAVEMAKKTLLDISDG